MRIILTICALVAAVNYATCLKCYYCAGSITSDCYEGTKSSMIVQDCNASHRNISTARMPMSDHDIDYEDKEDEEDGRIVITCVSYVALSYGIMFAERGCAYVYEKTDICDSLELYFDLLDCIHCDHDFCN